MFPPPPRSISPTGITDLPAAEARATGWTIAALESRLGLIERKGFRLEFSKSALTLAIEDNHVNATAVHTLVTLSADVRF